MKTKNLFTIGLIFSSSIIYGQNNTGKVIYDEMIKLDHNEKKQHEEYYKSLLGFYLRNDL